MSARPQLARKKAGCGGRDCVNAVGVDLNTASRTAADLSRGNSAHDGAKHRRGAIGTVQFQNRQQLLVSRLGPKAFEQCAELPAY